MHVSIMNNNVYILMLSYHTSAITIYTNVDIVSIVTKVYSN